MKHTFFLIFTLLFINCVVTTSNAQQALIDSLTKNINSQKGSELVDTYNALAQAYYAGTPQKIYIYATKALELSAKINYQRGHAAALCELGVYHQKNGAIVQAKELLTKSLQESTSINDLTLMGDVMLYMGECAFSQHDDYNTLNAFYKALALYKKSQNIAGEQLAYKLIGIAYKEQTNIKSAIYYFEKALAITNNNSKDLTKNYSELATLYALQKNYSAAQQMTDKAITSANSTKDTLAIAEVNYALATLYLHQKEYTKSIGLLTQTINNVKQLSNRELMAKCYNSISIAYFLNANIPTALLYTDSALLTLQTSKDKKLIAEIFMTKANIQSSMTKNTEAITAASAAAAIAAIIQNIQLEQQAIELSSKLLYRQGNYKVAFEMLVKSNLLKDSLNNRAKRSQQLQQEFNTAFESQIGKDTLNTTTRSTNQTITNQKNVANNMQLWPNTIIITISCIVILLISILLFVLIRSSKKINTLNKIIAEQKIKTEPQPIPQKPLSKNTVLHAPQAAKQEEKKEEPLTLFPKESAIVINETENVIKKRATDYFILGTSDHNTYKAIAIDDTQFMIAALALNNSANTTKVINTIEEIIKQKKTTKPNEVLHTIINQYTISTDSLAVGLYNLEENAIEACLTNSDIYIYRKAGSKGLQINGKQQLPIKYNKEGIVYKLSPNAFSANKEQNTLHEFILYKIGIEKGDTIFTILNQPHLAEVAETQKLKQNQIATLLLDYGLKNANDQRLAFTQLFDEWKQNEQAMSNPFAIGITL